MRFRRRAAQAPGELSAVLKSGRGLLVSVGVFSVFVNMLMLTGPLFMLQIYDRVLSSRSEETLLALFLLVTALFAIMGVLDYVRGRVAARVGASFQSQLDQRVFKALLERSLHPETRSRPLSGLQDLESIQRFLSSPVALAIFDLPWVPLFYGAIFIFHPALGWLAVMGGLILVAITLFNQLLTSKPVRDANVAAAQSQAFAEDIRSQSELVLGLGMVEAAIARWRASRDRSLAATISTSDKTGTFGSMSKTFRFFLQSAMLAMGAFLVLKGEMTAGAMIAGSIMLGRALAPIEQAIGAWPVVQRARHGWISLNGLLQATPPEPERTRLPRPKAHLVVQQVSVIPPGEDMATLRMMSFELLPGTALGIIGASGAGKTSLARAITGIWRPAAGEIRLDGATLDQYGGKALGEHIGYLPQDVALFNATVAENIARLAPRPDPALVVEAARKASAHDIILKMPDGYDTKVPAGGGRLSGGQKQRIGLARALYGDPVLLVLDEPNSNLDSHGSNALNESIRRMKSQGKSVIIIAHRPAAIAECELLMVIEDGRRKAFGRRDEVLKEQVRNYTQVSGTIGAEARK